MNRNEYWDLEHEISVAKIRIRQIDNKEYLCGGYLSDKDKSTRRRLKRRVTTLESNLKSKIARLPGF